MKEVMSNLFSKRSLLKIANNWIFLIGLIALVSELANLVSNTTFHLSLIKLIVVILTLLIVAIIRNYPTTSITKKFKYPDTKVTLKIGDLLKQEGDTVIGFTNTFDTKIGSVINPNSIQGQFQQKLYNGDEKRLDEDLNSLLPHHSSVMDHTKTNGKNLRYPIGTTVVIHQGGKKYYCCAYSRMNNQCVAQSSLNDLWLSLECLWEKIKTRGEQCKVNLPIIGSGLARVQGVTHDLIVKLILLSFVANSRISRISEELIIIVSKQDKRKINFKEIEDFLRSLL